MSNKVKPEGIFTILPLAFSESFDIKEDVLLQAIDWAVGAGAKGIVATGSVGEFSHLTEAEREHVMDISLGQIRKNQGTKAVSMTAAAGTLETIRWTKLAQEMGYDYALIVPPYYWKVGDDEVYRHFQMVNDAVDIPIIVYNNPITSKFTIKVPFAERLAELPGVVAMKEMSHDMAYLMSMYDTVGDKISMMQTFRVYLMGLMLGAAGGSITSFGLPALRAHQRAVRRRQPGGRGEDPAGPEQAVQGLHRGLRRAGPHQDRMLHGGRTGLRSAPAALSGAQ